MAKQIQLDSREPVEIVDSNGEVTGSFLWNPSDLDIVKRCEKVMDFFEHMDSPKADNSTDALFALSDTIKQQFDYLISPGASEALFQYSNPLSPLEDGSLYAEYVLTQIVSFVESELSVRIGRTTKKIEQYTAQYSK